MKQRFAIIGTTLVRKVLCAGAVSLSPLTAKPSLYGFLVGNEQSGVRHGVVIRAHMYVFTIQRQSQFNAELARWASDRQPTGIHYLMTVQFNHVSC